MSGSDLFTGTLDILILRAVQDEALHGYAIGQMLRDISGGVLDVTEGVMYPALHRLEGRGLLTASWGPSKTGRRAKHYCLTDPGRRHLCAQAADWENFTTAVESVLNMTRREAPPAANKESKGASADPRVAVRSE